MDLTSEFLPVQIYMGKRILTNCSEESEIRKGSQLCEQMLSSPRSDSLMALSPEWTKSHAIPKKPLERPILKLVFLQTASFTMNIYLLLIQL